jgi:hypothetical protein
MGRMSTERLDIYKKNLFNNYRNMQERINLAISVEELKSLFEQSKGLSKEPSSLERIQFAIDTQTLKALIKPEGISNVRPLPPIERINFSISKKELESLVFLSYKKSEQKKKKEEQVKKQPSQIQAQPQQSYFPAGHIIFFNIAKIIGIYDVLVAAGILLSQDFALLINQVYMTMLQVIEGNFSYIVTLIVALFLITIAIYHISSFVNITLKRHIGIINGIVLHLVSIIPAIYIQSKFFCFGTNNEPIDYTLIVSKSTGRLDMCLSFIVSSMLFFWLPVMLYPIFTIILHIFGNKEYRIPKLI